MKIGAIMMICVIISCACDQTRAETFGIALVDMSGSVLADSTGNKGKDSPFSKNLAELKKAISKLGKNDELIVIGFGRKSDVVLLKVRMPKQAGPMNQNLVATREAAIKKLQDNLATRTSMIDSSRTDVIGACFRASRLFEENRSDAETKRLLVYSDMLDNESMGLSLKRLTTGSHKEFLKKAGAGSPDLKGVEIVIYSAFTDIREANTVQTEVAIKELKLLWSEYFRHTGGMLKAYITSY